MHVKQPYETLVVAVPMGAAIVSGVAVFAEGRGDVAAATAGGAGPAAGPALTVEGWTVDGAVARVTVSGGADGERYLLTVRAVTAAGAREREAEVGVFDLEWFVPSVGAPYLTAAAFVQRYGYAETVTLTNLEGGDRIDAARLGTAIADAQAEADSYLAGRFAVPLATVPDVLATIVYDLAVARLCRGVLPDDVKARSDRAQAQLRDLAKGVTTLPGAAQLAPSAAPAQPVLFEGRDRLFTRERMAGL